MIGMKEWVSLSDTGVLSWLPKCTNFPTCLIRWQTTCAHIAVSVYNWVCEKASSLCSSANCATMATDPSACRVGWIIWHTSVNGWTANNLSWGCTDLHVLLVSVQMGTRDFLAFAMPADITSGFITTSKQKFMWSHPTHVHVANLTLTHDCEVASGRCCRSRDFYYLKVRCHVWLYTFALVQYTVFKNCLWPLSCHSTCVCACTCVHISMCMRATASKRENFLHLLFSSTDSWNVSSLHTIGVLGGCSS